MTQPIQARLVAGGVEVAVRSPLALDISLPGGVRIEDAGVAASAHGRWRRQRFFARAVARADDTLSVTSEQGDVLRIDLLPERDGVLLTWHPARPAREAAPLCASRLRGLRPERVYTEGWQSWSAPAWRHPRTRQPAPRLRPLSARPLLAPGFPARLPAGASWSDGPLVLSEPGGPSLLIGFISCERHLGHVSFGRGRGPGIVAGCGGAGAPVHETETVCILSGSDPWRLLGRWAELAGGRLGAITRAERLEGWCSWYQYGHRFTEEDLLWNLPRIEKLNWGSWETGGPVVMVDDGWQRAVGDWDHASPGFSRGTAAAAEAIRRHHARPGIWVAPLVTRDPRDPASLRDDTGRPVTAGWNPAWGGRFWALDPAHPETRTRLERAFRRLAGEGWAVFKLDFLYAGLLRGARSGGASSVAAYRELLARIREWTEGAYLLGCGAPLVPSIGCFDAMRVGPDTDRRWVHPVQRLLGWPFGLGAKAARDVSAMRTWMHGRLWVNDPDCTLLRLRDTRLRGTQVKSAGAVASMTTGLFFLSDAAEHLPPERERWLREWLPVAPEGFRIEAAEDDWLVLGRSFESDAVRARVRLLVNRRGRATRAPLGPCPEGWVRVRRSRWPFADDADGGFTAACLEPDGWDVVADVELRPDVTFCGDWGRSDLGFHQLEHIDWDAATGRARLQLSLSRKQVHRVYVTRPDGMSLAEGRVTGGVPPVRRQRFIGCVVTGGGAAELDLRFEPQAAPEPPIPAIIPLGRAL